MGCSNYPKCKTGFPLPQQGEVTAMGTKCKVCGHPMIQVTREGKRPFRMCILPTCESKKPKEEKAKTAVEVPAEAKVRTAVKAPVVANGST